jgi:hypothetical protein
MHFSIVVLYAGATATKSLLLEPFLSLPFLAEPQATKEQSGKASCLVREIIPEEGGGKL